MCGHGLYHICKFFDFFSSEREKFYPGPGLEPRPLAFHANALTN